MRCEEHFVQREPRHRMQRYRRLAKKLKRITTQKKCGKSLMCKSEFAMDYFFDGNQIQETKTMKLGFVVVAVVSDGAILGATHENF